MHCSPPESPPGREATAVPPVVKLREDASVNVVVSGVDSGHRSLLALLAAGIDGTSTGGLFTASSRDRTGGRGVCELDVLLLAQVRAEVQDRVENAARPEVVLATAEVDGWEAGLRPGLWESAQARVTTLLRASQWGAGLLVAHHLGMTGLLEELVSTCVFALLASLRSPGFLVGTGLDVGLPAEPALRLRAPALGGRTALRLDGSAIAIPLG